MTFHYSRTVNSWNTIPRRILNSFKSIMEKLNSRKHTDAMQVTVVKTMSAYRRELQKDALGWNYGWLNTNIPVLSNLSHTTFLTHQGLICPSKVQTLQHSSLAWPGSHCLYFSVLCFRQSIPTNQTNLYWVTDFYIIKANDQSYRILGPCHAFSVGPQNHLLGSLLTPLFGRRGNESTEFFTVQTHKFSGLNPGGLTAEHRLLILAPLCPVPTCPILCSCCPVREALLPQRPGLSKMPFLPETLWHSHSTSFF